jgi:hypothetical protein
MTEDYQGPTPPPELVQRWRNAAPPLGLNRESWIATAAARWGSDQELEACVEWLRVNKGTCFSSFVERDLRAARRPKPSSLAEEALDSWDRLRNEAWCEEIDFDLDFIRRALERLQELENND